jgi:hypothetical protein
MNTRVVGPSRVVAAAGAAVITAVGAWAFVTSSASIERDPFHFASIMAANARAHVALAHRGTASKCPNNPEAQDQRAPVCLRG